MQGRSEGSEILNSKQVSGFALFFFFLLHSFILLLTYSFIP